MAAYYNEIDPFAAQWLRNLIKAGHIAEGDVDERSIVKIDAADLREFTQCHFFAGIGVWSHALRSAGWPDYRPVWTGSCPCQPFSAAGRKRGFADERHLWPTWFQLIEKCRPPVVFGEQVASPDGLGWLDTVSSDLEGADYALGAADLCAAGVGAPHIRQRLYFVADSGRKRRDGESVRVQRRGSQQEGTEAARSGAPGTLADDAQCGREEGLPSLPGHTGQGNGPSDSRVMGNSASHRRGEERQIIGRGDEGNQEKGNPSGPVPGSNAGVAQGDTIGQGLEIGAWQDHGQRLERPIAGKAGVVGGFWGDADLVWCQDGKYRPVGPDSFPLAHGIAGRVGQIRAYGNALVAPVAEVFVKAYMETTAVGTEEDPDLDDDSRETREYFMGML